MRVRVGQGLTITEAGEVLIALGHSLARGERNEEFLISFPNGTELLNYAANASVDKETRDYLVGRLENLLYKEASQGTPVEPKQLEIALVLAQQVNVEEANALAAYLSDHDDRIEAWHTDFITEVGDDSEAPS